MPFVQEMYHEVIQSLSAQGGMEEAVAYLHDHPELSTNRTALLEFLAVQSFVQRPDDNLQRDVVTELPGDNAQTVARGDVCEDIREQCPDIAGQCPGGGVVRGYYWDAKNIFGFSIGNTQLEVSWNRIGDDPDAPIGNCCCTGKLTGVTASGAMYLGDFQASQLGAKFNEGCEISGGSCQSPTTKALACFCCIQPHLVVTANRECMLANFRWAQKLGFKDYAVTLRSGVSSSETLCAPCIEGSSPYHP